MEKDILFIHVPKLNNNYNPIGDYIFILYMPFGLLGLTDLLVSNGYRSSIVHLGVELIKYKEINLNNIIAENNPHIIGLSLHWHHQSFDVIQTAKKIKEINPNIKILLGGLTASYFCDEIMKDFECIDFIIKGEAETPILELLKQVNNTGNFGVVPNLMYRENGEVKSNPVSYVANDAVISSMNFTNFSLLKDYETYVKSLNSWVYIKGFSKKTNDAIFKNNYGHPVALGRGCINDCSYCGGSRKSHEIINNRHNISFRSVDSVIESIQDIEKYGFNYAMFNYDPLPPQESEIFYFELFEKIKQLNTKLSINIERWFLPSKEFIVKFKDSLNENSIIDLTINSQNEELRIRNDFYFFSNEELENCLCELEKHGVRTSLFFSIGLPFESKKDLIEMKKYQNKLKNKYKYIKCRTNVIEIEPCNNISLNSIKYDTKPERNNFIEYYRHHSNKNISHLQALGHLRNNCMPTRELNKFMCKNFCPLFKSLPFSRTLCNLMTLSWKSGLMKFVNKFIDK